MTETKINRKLKTPSIREKFSILLINKDFKKCAEFIKENPKDKLWYLNLIRETYKLSLFWNVALEAMLISSNSNVKNILISNFLIQHIPSLGIEGGILRISISNEASKENMERMCSKVNKIYKERGTEKAGDKHISIHRVYDTVSKEFYYKLDIYPRTSKRTVLEFYNFIMQQYKEAGIYERWQEKKDTVNQLKAVLLKESGCVHKEIGEKLKIDENYISREIERGKKKIRKLKSGPRSGLNHKKH